ncbi:MAG: carbohydrate ABC transporter permease, partial [Bacteroidaceae bacterium]|nr:carbohydrate ABC transporter permease [Bacteroidaceae bacterium]
MLNTIWALILPGAINTFNMIVMKSFFSSIPAGLEESARIDGAGHFRILVSIVLPLSLPIIATLSLF